MKIFNYPLSFNFIKYKYLSFKKKLSLIRLTHNYFLKTISIKCKTIDLGAGDGSNLTYYDYINCDDAKIEKADFYKHAENKIDLESNDNLFKSNLFYECCFIVNNKIILFKYKNCFLKFRELKKLNIKKENLYLLGKKNKTVFI